jgi:XTP/dITP diphosphohydrolase
MKTVYIATSNMNKAASIKKAMRRQGIDVKHIYLEMPEPRSYDMREIAKAKVLYAYKKTKRPCIVLDTGFFVDSINGFPRTFVNYALETVGIEGILKLVEGRERSCEFRNCLAYYDGISPGPRLFESVNKGRLSSSPKGTARHFHWSRLFLIFIPDGERKTLAQMTKGEFDGWHKLVDRDSYAGKFANWFSER